MKHPQQNQLKRRPTVLDISDLVHTHGIPTNKSGGGVVMAPTMNLRVYVYTDNGKQKHKIQQEWVGVDRNGARVSQWKDLPVVYEDKGEK